MRYIHRILLFAHHWCYDWMGAERIERLKMGTFRMRREPASICSSMGWPSARVFWPMLWVSHSLPPCAATERLSPEFAVIRCAMVALIYLIALNAYSRQSGEE